MTFSYSHDDANPSREGILIPGSRRHKAKGDGMSWTDERVELLKKLWGEGRSASQIAGELSNGITRNAVIGKVHRLGLSGRVKAPSMSTPRPRAPKPHINRPMMRSPSAPMTRGANALSLSPRMDYEPAPRPMEDVVVPLSNPVTIIDLRESMCKWPLGDPTTPEFRYCGAVSPVGVSYCTFHSRVAYQPAQDRRRERDRERRALIAQRAHG